MDHQGRSRAARSPPARCRRRSAHRQAHAAGRDSRLAGQGRRALQTDRDGLACRARRLPTTGTSGSIRPARAVGRRRRTWSLPRTGTRRKRALAEGKKVVLFPRDGNTAPVRCRGSFLPVFWSPVWFPQQIPTPWASSAIRSIRLLAQFPTEFYSNWQWYELLQHSRS